MDVITKLETRDLTLVESLSAENETIKSLEKVQVTIGKIINVTGKTVLQTILV